MTLKPIKAAAPKTVVAIAQGLECARERLDRMQIK